MTVDTPFWLRNLIVLGQGAPNQLKDGRQCKCVCAYAPATGDYHRIYPVPIGWLRKWDQFSVEVERNPNDHRPNTWKIRNSKADWKKLHTHIRMHDKYPQRQRPAFIQSLPVTVLSTLMDQEASFGLVTPRIKDFLLEQRNPSTTVQLTLPGVEHLDDGFAIINQHDYKYKPYLVYECVGDCRCKNTVHRQQIIEWGCYEWMRKNPAKATDLRQNLRLDDTAYEVRLLLGNIHKAPKTYIIIDVLRFKRP